MMTGLVSPPSAPPRRRPSRTVMTALFFVDRHDCPVLGGCQCEIGWTHDGDSDGCLAVGGSVLQDTDAGQEELRFGESRVERASGEGGSGGTRRRNAAHYE